MAAQPRQHRILLITTGGTIAGNVAHDDDPSVQIDLDERRRLLKQDAGGLGDLIAETVEKIEDEVNLEITVEPLELADIDSSDVQPKLWADIAQVIKDRFDNYESFIITHGTNTLGYTCAALSFAIANSGKPIVLTGSQVPNGFPGSDAIMNLQNALRVATWQGDGGGIGIGGVVAVFGSFIITGTRVKKDTEFDYDAFKSFGVGAIGRIGRIINMNSANLEKHNSYLQKPAYPVARRASQLIVDSGFNMKIASLTEFPGMGPELFKNLVESSHIEGFVLRAFGAGDPASDLQSAFKYLKEKEIPIIVTTQAPNGSSNFQVNEGGAWLRENQAAIPAHDMSIESMTTKLGWLLNKKTWGGRHLGYQDICLEMITDLRGEINVMWEMRH